MPTEADTCRKFVLPKLYAAGWDDDQIREQRTFTDGRILVAGTKVWRRPQKRQAVPAPIFTGQSDSDPAQDILTELLKQYSTDGELQFTLPDVLKVPPISNHGNVNEIISKFGGEDELRNAVNKLQALMYAA